jgi:hypothetical protein
MIAARVGRFFEIAQRAGRELSQQREATRCERAGTEALREPPIRGRASADAPRKRAAETSQAGKADLHAHARDRRLACRQQLPRAIDAAGDPGLVRRRTEQRFEHANESKRRHVELTRESPDRRGTLMRGQAVARAAHPCEQAPPDQHVADHSKRARGCSGQSQAGGAGSRKSQRPRSAAVGWRASEGANECSRFGSGRRFSRADVRVQPHAARVRRE